MLVIFQLDHNARHTLLSDLNGSFTALGALAQVGKIIRGRFEKLQQQQMDGRQRTGISLGHHGHLAGPPTAEQDVICHVRNRGIRNVSNTYAQAAVADAVEYR